MVNSCNNFIDSTHHRIVVHLIDSVRLTSRNMADVCQRRKGNLIEDVTLSIQIQWKHLHRSPLIDRKFGETNPFLDSNCFFIICGLCGTIIVVFTAPVSWQMG